MTNLVIIPTDLDTRYDWHLHSETCSDVKKYDSASLSARWTVTDLEDAKGTLQDDYEFYCGEGVVYDFYNTVKIYPCVKKLAGAEA